MLSAELERLQQLRQSGALTEAEFQQAKQRVLQDGSGYRPTPEPAGGWYAQDPRQGMPVGTGSGVEPTTVCGLSPRLWNTLMHLSQLLTWTVLGVVVPIVMWVVSKDESREANRQGLIILNWMLSTLIYGVISFILTFVVIGLPMLIVLAALHVIFPIIGAIQANNGVAWKYPLSINFFDPDHV